MAKSALTLVLLGACLPTLSLAQRPTITDAAVPTTTRSTLESLASLGQAGLSFLNTLLNPVTQSTTARQTATPFTITTPTTRVASTTPVSSTPTSSTLPSAVTFTQPSTSRTTASSTSNTSSGSSSSSSSINASSTSPASITNSPISTSSKSSNTLAIALGVTFGVLAIILIIFLLWCCRHRRRRRLDRPDSPLSDSSYAEKAIPRTGVTSFSTDRTLSTSEPTPQQPLLDTPATTAGAGAVAAGGGINRKPVAARNSWGPRGAPFPVEPPMQQSHSNTSYDHLYAGGSSAYPARPSPQRPRSWQPPPGTAMTANTSHNTSSTAPLVSPVDNNDDGYNESGTSYAPYKTQYRSYRPVSEQNPHRYYASPQRPDGFGIQPQYRPRRYSGGSAWQQSHGGPGNGGRPRSTPLSPLAQYPSR